MVPWIIKKKVILANPKYILMDFPVINFSTVTLDSPNCRMNSQWKMTFWQGNTECVDKKAKQLL